ncbi:hypothetical protein [Acinetobacter sp. GG2]|nr:hypothetical protein [Acinetobacter sp. GG2]
MIDNQQFIDKSTALATNKAATYGGNMVGAASGRIGSIDLTF